MDVNYCGVPKTLIKEHQSELCGSCFEQCSLHLHLLVDSSYDLEF